jgi:hydroxyacylglutathione hydrolase
MALTNPLQNIRMGNWWALMTTDATHLAGAVHHSKRWMSKYFTRVKATLPPGKLKNVEALKVQRKTDRFEIIPLKTRLSNAFLVLGPQATILVDSGSPGEADLIKATLRRMQRQTLDLIFLTHAHYDHFGAAAALKRFLGAPVAIHAADAEALRLGETRLGTVRGRGRLVRIGLPVLERFFPAEGVKADILLQDGDRIDDFGFPAQVLYCPGHTPGSSTLVLDDGTAFAGDLVSTTGQPHAQRYYAHDWDALERSLKDFQAARPRLVYPGHGKRPLGQAELQSLKCCL